SKNDSRWNATRDLEEYIDEFGYLRPGVTEEDLQKILNPKCIEDFRKVGYDSVDYPWLNSRKGSDNFKNLQNLYK
ncbi:hypothetical protein K0G28_29140, partial [Bacteroides faecis]|nr:hypothetical protein [Bacteroides faecis]